ncbi:MAG TPA: CPBP family glutamic-type intramembrane protease [Terriglobales bacterium]|nr:CPBP family glutamic-type intramembrane protease [Terriglobales bacterium]
MSAAAAWLQIAVAYAFIMAAVWTPDGPLKLAWMSLAAVCILLFTVGGGYSIRQLGIGMPTATATVHILTAGVVLAAAVPLVARLLHQDLGPVRAFSWHSVWQYFVWALLQQFILQSFFYLRFESLLGSRRAVLIAAAIFAAAHIPSPVLTCITFLGGLFFCEMFRRYRNIVPLGAVHALLGMMVATSFSDAILHHMHVGIGYLSFHP